MRCGPTGVRSRDNARVITLSPAEDIARTVEGISLEDHARGSGGRDDAGTELDRGRTGALPPPYHP